MRRLLLLFTALAVLLLVLFFARGCGHRSESVARTFPTPPATTDPQVIPAAERLSSTAASPGLSTAAVQIPSPSPDRIQMLDCTMDERGFHLTRTTGAVGRVKAPPLSVSPWRLEFTVFNRAGEKIYAGSLDHPLHPRYEYTDGPTSGRLHAVTGIESSAAFQLRLPGELPAARIAFFEVRPDRASTAPPVFIGEILLP